MEKQKHKLIVLCAPSASGKTTIYKRLLKYFPILSFSISATTRKPRGDEKDGVDYYFMSVEEFKVKEANEEFAEWEEVYEGKFYGTLKSEIKRINDLGMVPILDVDVKGAQSIKKIYGDDALIIFIKAPSVEEIIRRLKDRGTDTPEQIQARIDRLPEELAYEDKCDVVIVNEDLEKAVGKSKEIVSEFLALAA